jgi:hypothetical protein
LLKQYMRPLEDFGLVEFASAQIDKTAREVMSSAVWPVSMSLPQGHTLSGRTERKSDEPICPDRTNEYLKQQSGGVDPEIVVARHTLAPFEPSGGKLLSMVQLSETNLNFSLVSPRCDAPVQWMYTLGIAPNTDVKVDADLSLIVVNSKTEPKTWLYRFDWVRLCRQDELPKNQVSQTCVVDFVPIVTWTVHSNGPYEVVDSSRVRAGGIEYQLRRDYGPRPLNAMEAEVAREELGGGKSPVDRSRDKIPGCDELSGYGAVLAAEKVAGKYDTLRIFDVTADRRCEDYPVRAKEIMRFDLGSYSIRRVAFARKLSPIKDVPDFIYLQSQEQDVIYKLVWNPTAVRSLLCDTLRNQNDGGVPLPDALPISIDVKAMLSNDAGINDLSAEICKIESDDLATK